MVPQYASGLDIAASSRESDEELFQSFNKSPGSEQSDGSDPEVLFDNHFVIDNMEDRMLDNMLLLTENSKC